MEMYGSEDSGTFCKHDGTNAVIQGATDKLPCAATKTLGVAVVIPKNGTLFSDDVLTIRSKFGPTELTRIDDLTIEGPESQLGFIRVTFAVSAAALSTQSAVRLPLVPDNLLTAGNSDLRLSSSLSLMLS